MRQPGRNQRRTGQPRGSVLPLVCVMLLVFVGCAALAVDIPRMYVVAAEVQTAADAATLAATRAVRLHPTRPGAEATAAAQQIASLNRAANAPAQVRSADVNPKRYNPRTDQLSDTTWDGANAVTVVARSAPMTYAFAGALGLAPTVVLRQATGAFTMFAGMSCVRPMLIPYTSLYNAAFGTAYASAPDMTASQMQALGGRSPTGRTFTFVGPYTSSLYGNRNDNGAWSAVDYTDGGGTMASYTNWARGINCSDAKAVVRKSGASIHRAGTSNQFVTAMTDAISSVCYSNNSASDGAKCWAGASATSPGVVVRVAVGDPSNTAAGSPVTIRMVMTLTVMCYYRSYYDHCTKESGYPGGGWDPGQSTNYPEGTFVVMLNSPFPGVLAYTPDMVFGTNNPMAPSVTGGAGVGTGVVLVR